MGVPFRIILYSADETAANHAAATAFDRVEGLDRKLSDYDPHSELRELCLTAGLGRAIKVSDDLYRVLRRSLDLSRRSNGAFDVTVGPLVRLWRRARRNGKFPDARRLAAARQAVGYQYVRLEDSPHRVELLKADMRLDLGGIAKGYAVDAALKVLRDHGVAVALVDAGGDMAAGDPPPGSDGWRVGIAPLDRPDAAPSRFLRLAHGAVATSGDAFQFVEIGGVRYSHIVDPHTGVGLTDRSSVTIVARNCTTADGLASAVSVLGPHDGLRLVDATDAAAALIVRREGGRLATFTSKRWKTLAIEPTAARAP